jgi:hypothetical protein
MPPVENAKLSNDIVVMHPLEHLRDESFVRVLIKTANLDDVLYSADVP